MSFVNFSTKEITSKIVYYGPGLCGKTTTLQYIYDSIVPENKGQMVSLATDVDRTIYFDFLPLKLGKIQDFSVRIQLYTVPGQVRYNSTRKLVLSGTDGVVFVADSQRDLLDEDSKSHRNLSENLEEQGLPLATLPHIVQFNKRDLPNLATVDEMNKLFNPHGCPYFETCATTGEGVLDGLKTISKLVMQDLKRKGVARKKHYQAGPAMPHFNRTDTVLRPIIGPRLQSFSQEMAEGPDPDVLAGIDEMLGIERAPTPSDLFGHSAGPTPISLTFSTIFLEREVGDRLVELERAVEEVQSTLVQKITRELFARLIEDDRHFPPDMTESARISMLGISLRKYAHFYRLLSQATLTRAEGLFLLHFLIDVQFGKGMP